MFLTHALNMPFSSFASCIAGIGWAKTIVRKVFLSENQPSSLITIIGVGLKVHRTIALFERWYVVQVKRRPSLEGM